MQHSRYLLLRLLIPFVLLLLGCPPPQPPPEVFVEPVPVQAATGLTVMGVTDYLAPESQGAMLVHVQDPYTKKPQANKRVRVLLGTPGQDQEVFTGQTDEKGLVQVNFAVPVSVADPNQKLTISAETDIGPVQTQQDVYVGRVYNILISTDKPVYQPGQTIHLRGLALDSTALKAAQGQPLVLTVADPEGNKLMRRELTTSQYGIAAADFVLDSQAASGDYLLTAEMGPVSSTRSVEVKPYTLPRFEITFKSDKAFYLPGDTATGTVDAQYFFGKPVAGGHVSIKGFVTDVERTQVFELSGETDETGFYHYEFQVPDYFVGQLQNNTAQVDLEISVVDTANHSESVDESVTVAEKTILVDAVPESGFLRPGLANVIYLDTSYPDGRSAQATLVVTSTVFTAPVTIATDEFGLATLTMTPTQSADLLLDIQAQDAEGQSATQQLTLGSAGAGTAVLLRPDKAQYQIGETLNLDIHVADTNVGGKAVTAYLDVIKGGQTFGLVALPISGGMAQAAIDIDGSLLGTLELNAYIITNQGELVRDRRFVLVNPAPANVEVQTDAEVYKPGDNATVDITVSRDGAPMPGAVGVSIVDESVFSVGAQDPGFARTYFLLERELQEPRYEIHDFVKLGDDDPSPYDQKPESVKQASSGSRVAGGEGRGGRNQAQQVALMGFFAEELAAMPQPQPVAIAANPKSQIQNPKSATAWGWINRIALAAPLLGLAFYDGQQRRRRLLIGLVLFSLATFAWGACAAPSAAPMAGGAAAPAAAEAPADAMQVAADTTATRGSASEPPRLRQFFPETLFWVAEQETDANGHVQLEVPIADSITTWRISVLASDKDGNLGSAEIGMRVFQDFFVEPDLPRFLTVGDELAVPVSIFNYLSEAQEISLEVAAGDWFEFVQEPQLTFSIGPNEVAATYIPIRVTNFGLHDFQITATGSQMNDAVLRQVEVLPDGKPQAEVASGKLGASQTFTVALPPNAVAGTGRVTVKVYPGVVSQVIDGLEGMLQQPYGCFEQTSSTTYPNVLVLDYLKSTGQADPRLQLQAEQYINLGYQRLLSFEVNGFAGGFSLFGGPPPQTMLTAYGLKEFTDMSRVSYVDPALLERTANFLFQRQNPDGSWNPEGMTIESGLENLGQGNLLPTAYIAWALADAGYAQSEPVQRAVAYLQNAQATLLAAIQQANSGQGNNPTPTPAPPQDGQQKQDYPPPSALPLTQVDLLRDPYVLAMMANALIAADADARTLLDLLLEAGVPGADETLSWNSALATWMGGSGGAASIDATAMAATALLRANYQVEAAQQAINYIVSRRDPNGMFYSTQSTVLALKALLLAAQQGGEGGDATLTITLNGDRAETLSINDENASVVQQVSFDDLNLSGNSLTIQVEGERALQYQVITEYYLPWAVVQESQGEAEAMRIDVKYDRTELEVNDTVNVQAEIELLAGGMAGTILVDLGIPPGFSPVTEDLEQLVAQGAISRYELTGRQILVYLTNVPSGRVTTLNYRLLARFPIQAQTPSSQAYNYYTPEQQQTQPPQRVVVKLGTPQK